MQVQLPTVLTIAQAIQLSLSPVFMLAGIGALLNVLVGRMARVVDRVRDLEQMHAAAGTTERERHVRELRILDRRIRVINVSLFLAVSSAVMTCAVVAMLFIGELSGLRLGTVVALSFILAMLLLISSLVSFIVEVRASLRAVLVREDLLQYEMEGDRGA